MLVDEDFSEAVLDDLVVALIAAGERARSDTDVSTERTRQIEAVCAALEAADIAPLEAALTDEAAMIEAVDTTPATTASADAAAHFAALTRAVEDLAAAERTLIAGEAAVAGALEALNQLGDGVATAVGEAATPAAARIPAALDQLKAEVATIVARTDAGSTTAATHVAELEANMTRLRTTLHKMVESEGATRWGMVRSGADALFGAAQNAGSTAFARSADATGQSVGQGATATVATITQRIDDVNDALARLTEVVDSAKQLQFALRLAGGRF
ncbi:hypothetical protein ASE70_01930 [Sphingomonas sp. Leaf22]|uniref:hypothetical protein n=1 Tax=Sphingomonas sp. Leaf22 TaxID=1735687 RepID=UPI0006F3AD84|nr:hypothetical protein [Sphingomonas sp. Leaf22]KQM90201.1 hypothetical protein ASE70_01930 [Sphingomonas sp. Leaf22]